MKLYDLYVTLGLDDKAFTKSIGGVKETSLKAAKVIGTGFGTAFAGVTMLAKEGLKAAGELEQNIGGAEKVFGEFANQVQQAGVTAYKTMGMSQSDFLATMNKMGALMQGSGISIEDSMTLSSDAMRRAADVASIMGIDVSVAMESIAGAAKGNFTMMDNLGVAMNATTLEAYALKNGIDENYASMDNATKIGLAFKYFLEQTEYATGNYAAENETLAGSLTTAKASLENFISGVGSGEELAESLTNVGSVVSEKLQDLLPSLVSGISTLLTNLAPEIPGLVSTILPTLIEGAGDLLGGIAEVLPNLVLTVAQSLPDVLKAITDVDWGQLLVDLGETVLTIAQDVIAPLLGQWWSAIMGKINDIIDWILSPDLPTAQEIADKITAWWESVKNIMGTLLFSIFPQIGTIPEQTNAAAADVGAAVAGETGSETAGLYAGQVVKTSTMNPDSFIDFGAIISAFKPKATGLEYVPNDNYLASLHKGEAVLTKEQAKRWRRGEDDTMMVVQTPQETRPIVLMIDGTEIGAVMYDNMNRRIENGNLQQIFGMGG